MNYIFILAVLLAAVQSTKAIVTPGQEQNWGGLCRYGQKQSPINIYTEKAVKRNMSLQFYGYDNPLAATLVNTGTKLVAHFNKEDNNNNLPYVTIDGSNERYILTTIYFGWGTGHLIDGVGGVLETRIFHANEKYSPDQALLEPDGVISVTTLFKFSEDDSMRKFDEITSYLPTNENDNSIICNLNMNSFLPSNRVKFYRYEGSTVAPPCDESVTYIIYTGAEIARSEYEAIRNIRDNNGNPVENEHREIQPLYNRVVYETLGGGRTGGSAVRYTNTYYLEVYPEQDFWTGECITGRMQSPVNIETNSVQRKSGKIILEDYEKKLCGNVMVDENTVKIDFSPEDNNQPLPTLSIDGLNDKFVLHFITFHWGSDHMIDGLRYPLETSIYHYNSIYDRNEALGRERGTCILSVLSKFAENESLRKYQKFIPSIPKTPNSPPKRVCDLDLNSFLPRSTNVFYRYDGSLPKTPCRENVLWIIPRQINEIALEEWNELKNIQDESGNMIKSNFRRPQPLNSRTIDLISEDI